MTGAEFAAQRSAIDRSGLTQVELAKILGVSERTIQRWEAAKTVPNVAAHALECVAMLFAEQP
jgi:DNA-binding transcriptional regulator YiaG